MDDEILRSVVLAAGEVALEDGLGTRCVTLLSIEGSTGHVRDHSIAATPWVLGGSERMVLGSRLREPNITAITVQLASLEGFSNILLDDNGTTSSVDEPCAYPGISLTDRLW